MWQLISALKENMIVIRDLDWHAFGLEIRRGFLYVLEILWLEATILFQKSKIFRKIEIRKISYICVKSWDHDQSLKNLLVSKYWHSNQSVSTMYFSSLICTVESWLVKLFWLKHCTSRELFCWSQHVAFIFLEININGSNYVGCKLGQWFFLKII